MALGMLSVSHLSRLHLGPFDFHVDAGEIVALTGPSGAGKSLLLRAVADLDPNDGDIRLEDRARMSMSASDWRRQVMYVPAHSGWWADLVEPHFESASRARAVDILQRLGLESTALGWHVANLSTGERQRLSLARALALDPRVLLLDEPTSGLDADNVARAEKLLNHVAKTERRAALFVTHDLSQAQRLASRILRLDGGRIEEVRP